MDGRNNKDFAFYVSVNLKSVVWSPTIVLGRGPNGEPHSAIGFCHKSASDQSI